MPRSRVRASPGAILSDLILQLYGQIENVRLYFLGNDKTFNYLLWEWWDRRTQPT